MREEDKAADDDASAVVEQAVGVVAAWLRDAAADATRAERRSSVRLHGVVSDEHSVRFAMRFVDRVIRADDHKAAARQLRAATSDAPLPAFLSRLDRVLLRAGARLGPVLPGVVLPLARRRLRGLVGHLVIDASPRKLRRHLAARRKAGFGTNVNLLGEAVLGEAEADRRLQAVLRLLDEPDIDYVSVKTSALVPQLNHWDHEGSLVRVCERLRVVLAHAARTSPPTFVNLDMEEHRDLELTLDAFTTVLAEPGFADLSAGIVLQAYLPDSFPALRQLIGWANERHDLGSSGQIKIRLVKGANLAMERVEAAMHGWEQAAYRTKAETDANYKRCIDWAMTPERMRGVRVGIASHNLFDIAWASLLAERRSVSERTEIEMLEGMAPAHARLAGGHGRMPLLYTPVVAGEDFDVAISYLFRRLEENASEENFIRHLATLHPDSAAFAAEADKFRAAVASRHSPPVGPSRTQDRGSTAEAVEPGTPFRNEPDSDPALPNVRAWAQAVAERSRPGPGPGSPNGRPPSAAAITSRDAVDHLVAGAVGASAAWGRTSPAERQRLLYALAGCLSEMRGELVSVMMREARKTFAEADPEVSEAVDFVRYYGDRALDLAPGDAARFEPLGVVAVAPPWNFPVAIAAGGTAAALAAGNCVLLKPAPEARECAAVLAEAAWAAGIPREALQLVEAGDDECGQRLIAHPYVDAVILTGSLDTARLFKSWRPDLRLFAETSGKNAIVITPSADIDLAVADLARSAFGHSGQKCSAASLAICVGSAYGSPRFRRQLADAARSLRVGEPSDLATDTGPLIAPATGKLLRGLTRLDEGESWLVRPRQVDAGLWRPGVRTGVQPGSWFHRTECFGPVLGLMAASDLDHAVELQNATPFGLTGGIHSLDEHEVNRWLKRVEVGNAYVNRPIGGAIVRRQPFGGWHGSSVGPSAKTGGPNYVAQLGRWQPTARRSDAWLADAIRSDEQAWADEFGAEHDPTGLFCESNVFRYRPLERVAVRVVEPDDLALARVRAAAQRCGVPLAESDAACETAAQFAQRLADLGCERVRVLGPVEEEVQQAANDRNIWLIDAAVTSSGRIELQHYLREQSVTITLHRYGNLITQRRVTR